MGLNISKYNKFEAHRKTSKNLDAIIEVEKL